MWSIDRMLGVASLVLGLAGTGIAILWPTHRGVGWGFLIAAAVTALIAGVWVISRRYALKEYQSQVPQPGARGIPAPAQTLNQTGISIFNAPNFSQSQSQEQTHKRIEQKVAREPVFECRGARFVRYGYNVNSGELIREPYVGRIEEVHDHITFVDAALARVYYRPDPGVDSRLRVNAHIFFYPRKDNIPTGGTLNEVYKAIWDGDEPHVSKEFSAGYAHELILALVPAKEPQGIIGYEYGNKILKTDYGNIDVFTPEIHTLFGKEFSIKVELIAKLAGQIRCTLPPLWFELRLLPEPKLIHRVLPGTE
jgi:hypothetical protein